jgi:hypothetical protein
MPTILFADGFLAGSLLSLLLPVGVLIAILICFHLALKRLPGGAGGVAAPAPSASDTRSDGASTPAEATPGEP